MYNAKVYYESRTGEEIPLKRVNNAKNGDSNVFEILKQDADLYRIKIYSPSKDEENFQNNLYHEKRCHKIQGYR